MTDGKGGSSNVPEGWQLRPLNVVANIYDSLHQTPKFSNVGLPMVRVTDVKGGLLNLSDTAKVADSDFRAFTKRYAPKRGDIVFSRAGSYGNVSYAATDEKFCLGQNTALISSNSLDNYFLFLSLLSENTKQQIEKAVDGSSHKTVSLKVIKALDILFPESLEEQRKIAEILSAWDEAIEQQARLIELERERKRGLMQQLLTGRVRFTEFTGLEWRKVAFNDVLKLEIGGTPARKEPSYWDSGRNTENHWLSISDLKGKTISSTKERITDLGARKSNTKLLPTGSLVMSFKLTIGRRAILGLPMYTNEAICALIPKDSEVVDVEFLYQYLEIVDFEQGIDQAVKGKTLNKEKIKLLRLSLPTIEEQQKIATVLSAADAEIETLTAQLAAFKTQKRGMMQRLLTGKTRVRVA